MGFYMAKWIWLKMCVVEKNTHTCFPFFCGPSTSTIKKSFVCVFVSVCVLVWLYALNLQQELGSFILGPSERQVQVLFELHKAESRRQALSERPVV